MGAFRDSEGSFEGCVGGAAWYGGRVVVAVRVSGDGTDGVFGAEAGGR